MVQLMAGQVARDSWKPRALLLLLVVLPEPLVLLVLLLLYLLGYLRTLAHADELGGTASRQARAIFRLAQRRAEARGRRMRSDVLRHDDWVEQHMPGS